MERGFVIDQGHYDIKRLPRWTLGSPGSGWLGGLKSPNREVQHPVGSFRCAKCGYLEFYAGPEYGQR
jgi:hypothetical protein